MVAASKAGKQEGAHAQPRHRVVSQESVLRRRGRPLRNPGGRVGHPRERASTPSRTSPTFRSSSTRSTPARRPRWSRTRSPIRSQRRCSRSPTPRSCAATPFSASRSSTSSSRTAPTSTGPAPACWSICQPRRAAPQGRLPAARSRRHRRRLGLHVHAQLARALARGARSYQDWYLKYGLTSVDGVSEVASIGGFVRQYQVEVDPVKLRAYDIPLSQDQERDPALQQRRRRAPGRDGRERVYGARAGLRQRRPGLERSRSALGPGRHAGPAAGRRTRHIGPEMRRGVAEWNGEGRDGRRHRRGALRRGHAARRSPGQAAAGGAEGGLPTDVDDLGRLRPHRASSTAPSTRSPTRWSKSRSSWR